MIELVPPEVLEAFRSHRPGLSAYAEGKITIEEIGNGLINQSFKVCSESKALFFLQRINSNVFQNPREVQQNYITLSQYAEFEFTGIRMPWPVYSKNHETLFTDSKGNYWRAFEFISESKTFETADKPSRAKATAKAFAGFTAAFEDFNTGLLKEVIPGFHDLGLRYEQFEASLQTELYERIEKAGPLISELKNRERYRHFYELITASDEFPKRVMHHDAKIGNILFHSRTGRIICLVDYDTAMPGYFFSDLGDMIRSMAGKLGENRIEYDFISIRKEYYDAIVNGYLEVLGDQLTPSERKYIHSAGLIMIYMQALRFLADYLNGDTYYRTDHPGQNLERAKNQFSLLKALEEFLHKNYTFSI